ncbi:hypothetical protein KM043_006916 [Ampulex compressa]|nr:hypothetical protein KM043_006916 [Ampulex compressa]
MDDGILAGPPTYYITPIGSDSYVIAFPIAAVRTRPPPVERYWKVVKQLIPPSIIYARSKPPVIARTVESLELGFIARSERVNELVVSFGGLSSGLKKRKRKTVGQALAVKELKVNSADSGRITRLAAVCTREKKSVEKRGQCVMKRRGPNDPTACGAEAAFAERLLAKAKENRKILDQGGAREPKVEVCSSTKAPMSPYLAGLLSLAEDSALTGRSDNDSRNPGEVSSSTLKTPLVEESGEPVVFVATASRNPSNQIQKSYITEDTYRPAKGC